MRDGCRSTRDDDVVLPSMKVRVGSSTCAVGCDSFLSKMKDFKVAAIKGWVGRGISKPSLTCGWLLRCGTPTEFLWLV